MRPVPADDAALLVASADAVSASEPAAGAGTRPDAEPESASRAAAAASGEAEGAGCRGAMALTTFRRFDIRAVRSTQRLVADGAPVQG